MALKHHPILLIATTFLLLSCNQPTGKKNTELKPEKSKQVLANAQPNLSLKDAVKLAEAQFAKYLPTMLNVHNAYVDSQDTFTGDFTGDDIADIAIYFSLAPNEGGNTIVAQGLTLYKNTGTDVKVIAGYEPDYMFSFLKINKGKIYVEKLAYAETDGRCCPSIKTTHSLTITGSKVY